MKQFLLVGLGGGIGSMARYATQRWFATAMTGAFPWGTFVVNITGCLLIGLLWGTSMKGSLSDDWKPLLMAGLCGGFTTFSAFTMEGISLVREQKTGLFLLYVLGSICTGLLATYGGLLLSGNATK